MHFDLTDQYRAREGWIHRRDPRTKVVGVIAFLIAVGLVPSGAWGAFGLLWLVALGAATASRLGWSFAIRRSYIAAPFALVALPLLFTVPGRELFEVPVLGWMVSAEGLARFLSLLLRSWIAVQGAILLTAVTPFPDLLWALGALGMPPLLVATIGFMYRYVFVLADESLRMIRARASRSARPAGGRGPSPIWNARVAGNMVGSLFLRAMERSERVYAAMLARGYNGRTRSLAEHTMQPTDWATLAALVGLLATVVVWGHRI